LPSAGPGAFPSSSAMNSLLKNALVNWRRAHLETRTAEVSLRLSAMEYEAGNISEIPQVLISAACNLRQVACDILALMLKPPVADTA